MYEILKKTILNPTVARMEIAAPLVAKKAEPGQFIILRVDEGGERIPLTVADFDREKGTVTIIYQIVGATTMALNQLEEGDCLHDFVGPLGTPSHTEGLKKVAVIGGGVGCAIAFPVAKKLHEQGTEVHSIVGFRNKDLVILEEEFSAVSDKMVMMTDDGSYGTKGLVTNALKELLDAGEQYDEVIAIGPLIMMKFVAKLTKEYGVKTIVSMNPIMIDGTGMCGGCRLSVGGQVKFACVDGPDFDGHEVDFDEAMELSLIHICNRIARISHGLIFKCDRSFWRPYGKQRDGVGVIPSRIDRRLCAVNYIRYLEFSGYPSGGCRAVGAPAGKDIVGSAQPVAAWRRNLGAVSHIRNTWGNNSITAVQVIFNGVYRRIVPPSRIQRWVGGKAADHRRTAHSAACRCPAFEAVFARAVWHQWVICRISVCTRCGHHAAACIGRIGCAGEVTCLPVYGLMIYIVGNFGRSCNPVTIPIFPGIARQIA